MPTSLAASLLTESPVLAPAIVAAGVLITARAIARGRTEHKPEGPAGNEHVESRASSFSAAETSAVTPVRPLDDRVIEGQARLADAVVPPRLVTDCDPAPAPTGPAIDILEAVGFAVRLVAPQAAARSVDVAVEHAQPASVVGSRRDVRSIVHRALNEVVAHAAGSSQVRVSVRPLRGAVLLRISGSQAQERDTGPKIEHRAGSSGLTEAVLAAGGTILWDRNADRVVASIRLPRGDDGALTPAQGEDAR